MQQYNVILDDGPVRSETFWSLMFIKMYIERSDTYVDLLVKTVDAK